MSNLTVTPKWNEDINQIERSEAIVGGSNGVINLAPRQLAENLFWLKDDLNKKIDDIDLSDQIEKIKPLASLLASVGSLSVRAFDANDVAKDISIKYGEKTIDSGETISFVSPFSHACYQVVVSQTSSTGTVRDVSTSAPDTEGFIAYHNHTNPITVAYIAIGY